MIPGITAGYPARGGYTGPLDLVPGAVVAFDQFAPSIAMIGQQYAEIRSSAGGSDTFNYGETPPTAEIEAYLGANGGFYATWNDGSGNDNDATQADTAIQPQFVASQFGTTSAPTYDNDDGDDTMQTPSITLQSGGEFTAIWVGKMESGWQPYGICGINESGGAGNPFFLFGLRNGSDPDCRVLFQCGTSGSVDIEVESDAIPVFFDQANIVRIIVTDSSASVKVNGVNIPVTFTKTATPEAISGPMAVGSADVGAPGDTFYVGPYGCLYVYDRAKAAVDVDAAVALIAPRFGITLS